jgi:hypothetical protein
MIIRVDDIHDNLHELKEDFHEHTKDNHRHDVF